MTESDKTALKAAGFSDASIAREEAYQARVLRENAYFAANPSRLYIADHGQPEAEDEDEDE